MKLSFIRHGETDHNTKEIIQGRTETELNSQGREQAEALGKELLKSQEAGTHFSRMLVSPRLRAQQTATIINSYLRLTIETWDEFDEVHFGNFANKSWAEVATMTNDPEIQKKFRSMNFDLTNVEGESNTDVQTRLKHAIEKMYELNSEGHMLIVTHAPIIRMVFHLLDGEAPQIIENAQRYEFDV